MQNETVLTAIATIL